MANITFICGTPCGSLNIANLKAKGYNPEDVKEHLMTDKYGNKLFKLNNGQLIRI